MTETARRLHRLGAPHARGRAFAVVLGAVGVALAAAALGLVLAPAVSGVTLAWVLIALSLAAAVWAVWRARREAAAAPVGRLVESATGGRAGSVVGVVSPSINKGKGMSAALLLAADTRAAAFVSFAAPEVNATLRRTTRRRLAAGGSAALLGAVLFVAGAPASGRAAAFWHPVRAWRDAYAPVEPGLRELIVQVIHPAGLHCELAGSQDLVNPRVTEQSHRDRSDDWDAVLEIGYHLRIAAGCFIMSARNSTKHWTAGDTPKSS